MSNKEKNSQFISATISPSKKEALQQIAEAEDRTVSYIIGRAIDEYLEKHSTQQR